MLAASESRQAYITNELYKPFVIEHLTLSESTNANYALRKPLVVLVSKIDGEYKVEYPPLELYAFNEDRGEAIREFLAEFFDLCDDILPLDDAKLGKLPKCWKDELHTLVRRNGADSCSMNTSEYKAMLSGLG